MLQIPTPHRHVRLSEGAYNGQSALMSVFRIVHTIVDLHMNFVLPVGEILVEISWPWIMMERLSLGFAILVFELNRRPGIVE